MHILIADDESIIRLGLKSMLQQLGHEVTAAVNGREALQMIRRRPPDLAILDIKMPFTDGLQAAETIARTNPLPIILLTAFSDSDLISKASDLPIHGYLIKPVQANEIEAAISVAVKRFAENNAYRQKVANLEKALVERKDIEKAKGRLMQSGLNEAEAYKTLQKHARDNRISLHRAAIAVLKWATP